MLVISLFLMTLFLAYANGANDNFKGVATLYGSNATSFRTALMIGTIATLAGSLSSLFLAEALVKAFSGKGLVPLDIAASPHFLLAVAAGAASTVLLATLIGFPISTTHALIGALVGAGFMAAGKQLNLSLLGSTYVLPLLLSPVICVLLVIPVYKLGQYFVAKFDIKRESCVCIGPGEFIPAASFAGDAGNSPFAAPASATGSSLDATMSPSIAPTVSVGSSYDCVKKYDGVVLGITAQRFVDAAHMFSAAAVSFSRGLNDTPKIVGLLLVIKALDIRYGMLAIALAMAIGGLIHARKIAEIMSKKITKMNDGQALSANLVTAFMVIFASKLGVPVSTTHVSVGSITGIGIVTGGAHKGVIYSILMSWVLTLPVAALFATLIYWLSAF